MQTLNAMEVAHLTIYDEERIKPQYSKTANLRRCKEYFFQNKKMGSC